ncbi:MAG: thioesterase family protein [Gammaproteobacteria bacterium]|nr:thioesterase family protein [Gammaproteobacteria bacterium]
MPVTPPTTDEVRELARPEQFRIPPDWEDENGHVNVQFYQALYERGGRPLMESLGMDDAYFSERRLGVFDLEHHISYFSEIHVGETVSVYTRLLDRTDKRFHGIVFIVNDSRDLLACTLEFVASGADLEARRSAPYPDDVAAALDRIIAEHRKLSWDAPVCGVMSA